MMLLNDVKGLLCSIEEDTLAEMCFCVFITFISSSESKKITFMLNCEYMDPLPLRLLFYTVVFLQ